MRLIDADKLLKTPLRIVGEIGGKYHCETIPVKVIDKAPTINPEDLWPHGKNMTQMHASDEFICSVCGVVIQDMARYSPEDEMYYEYEPNFCPNCGARMSEEM